RHDDRMLRETHARVPQVRYMQFRNCYRGGSPQLPMGLEHHARDVMNVIGRPWRVSRGDEVGLLEVGLLADGGDLLRRLLSATCCCCPRKTAAIRSRLGCVTRLRPQDGYSGSRGKGWPDRTCA